VYLFPVIGSGNYEKYIFRMLKYGQKNAKQVTYSFKNISQILTKGPEVEIFADITMTSFNEITNDMNYINNIVLNKDTLFVSDNKEIRMYSKKLNSVKIPRGYDDFEEFLSGKGFNI
jgi:hypothetical protein